METYDYDADCGIEDAENPVNLALDYVELGLHEDPRTGLLTTDEVGEWDEETDEGYIYYVS